jgi:predicted DCC family thiol-disulfide oxidoreductase YuxK
MLLYDGSCGLCAGSVQWMLRRDRRGTLRFAPLQGETAARLRAAHPVIGQVDSMIWIDASADGGPSRVSTRSDAALRAAAYIGGVWSLAAVARAVPKAWRDRAYAFVARHRHLVGRVDACALPPPDARNRFLP